MTATAEDVRALGWTLALVGALALISKLLAAHPAASLAVQAFLAEWCAGRLGVAWTDPLEPPIETKRWVGRVALGTFLGAGAAALTLVILVMTGVARLGPGRAPVAGIFIALVTAGLTAMRDELLQRGIVIRILRRALPLPALLFAVGAVAAAARWGQGEGSVSPSALLLSGALGVAFGVAWLVERGAWIAWAAHTAWGAAWALAMTGGLLDVQLKTGLWGGGDGGPGTSYATATSLDACYGAAAVVLAMALAAAIALLRYKRA